LLYGQYDTYQYKQNKKTYITNLLQNNLFFDTLTITKKRMSVPPLEEYSYKKRKKRYMDGSIVR
jgi:hypothetical protein